MTQDTSDEQQILKLIDEMKATGVPFTQYLRPNGRKTSVLYQAATDDVREKAYKMIGEGFYFEIEELTTGQVSATITHSDTERDLAIVVAPNGPELVDSINGMIEAFDIDIAKQQVAEERAG